MPEQKSWNDGEYRPLSPSEARKYAIGFRTIGILTLLGAIAGFIYQGIDGVKVGALAGFGVGFAIGYILDFIL